MHAPSGSPFERPASRSAASRPRVLLVNDSPLALRLLRRLLEDTSEVVGDATDVDTALAQVARCRADVVIADLAAPDGGTLMLARRIRALWPWVQVVVHEDKPDAEGVGRARMAGAAEVVTGSLSAQPWELLAAVRRAYVAGLSARW